MSDSVSNPQGGLIVPDEPNRTGLPEPWYYSKENVRRLYVPLRAMRNLFLMVIYFLGIGWLLAATPILGLVLFAPVLLAPLLRDFPAALWGAVIGFALGVLAAGIYKWRFPHNRKAPKVLIPMGTGVGGLIGGGLALGGELGLEVAVLFCLLGGAGYAWLEGLPPKEES